MPAYRPPNMAADLRLTSKRNICNPIGCFLNDPALGSVPLNSYCYSRFVSTLQARVLTRYLRVIFASHSGNFKGKCLHATRFWQCGWRILRPACVPSHPRKPAAHAPRCAFPALSRGFTLPSSFFKFSFSSSPYYKTRSFSLPFWDCDLPIRNPAGAGLPACPGYKGARFSPCTHGAGSPTRSDPPLRAAFPICGAPRGGAPSRMLPRFPERRPRLPIRGRLFVASTREVRRFRGNPQPDADDASISTRSFQAKRT